MEHLVGAVYPNGAAAFFVRGADAACFQDPDGHLREVVFNPDFDSPG